MIIKIIIILSLANYTQNTSCSCYLKKCSRLKLENKNCIDNNIKKSCNNQDDMILNNNIECDCCLNNKCYLISNINCIMYKLLSFFTFFYFIIIPLNLHIIFNIYIHLFDYEGKYPVESKFEKTNLSSSFKSKYKGRFIIKSTENTDCNLKQNDYKIIKEVFDKIEESDFTGHKNFIIFLILIIIYFTKISFHFVLTYFIISEPFIYVYYSIVQHCLLITFYSLVWIIKNKFEIYSLKVINSLKIYEKKLNCKIIIYNKKQEIKFNTYNYIYIK